MMKKKFYRQFSQKKKTKQKQTMAFVKTFSLSLAGEGGVEGG